MRQICRVKLMDVLSAIITARVVVARSFCDLTLCTFCAEFERRIENAGLWLNVDFLRRKMTADVYPFMLIFLLSHFQSNFSRHTITNTFCAKAIGPESIW